MHRGSEHRCSKTSRRAANVRLITVASISMCHAWLVWPSKTERPHDRSSHQYPAQDRLDAGSRAFDFDRGDFGELCLQRQGAADVHGRCSPPLQFRNPEYCEDHRLHAEEQGERQPGMPRGDRRGRSQADQDKTGSGCTCRAKAGRHVACRTARSTQNEAGSGCACRAKAGCRSTCEQPAATGTKPVQAAPIEQRPATATPVEQPAPTETKPVQAAPVEQRPATATPVEQPAATGTKPVQVAPVEQRPATATPVEQPAATGMKPVQAAPLEQRPAIATPVDVKPVQAKPAPGGKAVKLAQRKRTHRRLAVGPHILHEFRNVHRTIGFALPIPYVVLFYW